MYDDVRADIQVIWTRMYSRFAWVYTDMRADVHPNRTILYFLFYILCTSMWRVSVGVRVRMLHRSSTLRVDELASTSDEASVP